MLCTAERYHHVVLDSVHGKVEAMAYRDAPFEEIERFIESIPRLVDDERSALWLLAWVERDHKARHERARERLAIVND